MSAEVLKRISDLGIDLGINVYEHEDFRVET
jgi:hypothetical protein